MADQASGIDLMRRRIERASRRPPPPPRTRTTDTPSPAAADATPGEEAVAAAAPTVVEADVVGEGGGATPAPAASRAGREPVARRARQRPRLAPDLPPVNLAIRVRKPLDDHLADLIHDLRRDGVRTSKVEVIEMLLWEQTGEDARSVRERLGVFRASAPRGGGAQI